MSPSDGYVTTDADFLGDSADLDRNIRKLLIAAGLSPDEREEFARLFRQHVDDHRLISVNRSGCSFALRE